MSTSKVIISHFSDVLCIWAYVSQIRLKQLIKTFDSEIEFEYHFLSIFGNTSQKFEKSWQGRGLNQGYHEHVAGIVEKYEHIRLHPNTWREDYPLSSMGCHIFLKALQLYLKEDKTTFAELAHQLRKRFFEDGQNIALRSVQMELAEQYQIPRAALENLMNDGAALAELASDHELAQLHQVTGSPTLVFNGGRQKLYGNVGYLLIEANIKEFLHTRPDKQASWC